MPKDQQTQITILKNNIFEPYTIHNTQWMQQYNVNETRTCFPTHVSLVDKTTMNFKTTFGASMVAKAKIERDWQMALIG